ncbi:hypothetical protein AGR7C_Cc110300 [Agrobacterium deltaense Zutra 3/1]|uniref:Uncharacterized protein n=1 Tax=Agrobacterium deltaense Zutra 3/1 TaxID=1183427 RepID=A0A1S7P3H0_9HYPH|nr:hypothetical protein AGR7C_Cc110300 [Agrobacterium deltaense Zutra 3/1]
MKTGRWPEFRNRDAKRLNQFLILRTIPLPQMQRREAMPQLKSSRLVLQPFKMMDKLGFVATGRANAFCRQRRKIVPLRPYRLDKE